MRGQAPGSSPPPAVDELFEAAYRSSGTAVLGYALRRSASREDALDVVAETFATAWRRRADMPTDPGEVRPWLFGVARRCLANAGRSTDRASRLGLRLADAFVDQPVPGPAALHDEQSDRHEVQQALDRLSDQDRELITLIAWEGLTPAQAATVLDLSPATTRVRLHRARARLREALSTPASTEVTDHAE